MGKIKLQTYEIKRDNKKYAVFEGKCLNSLYQGNRYEDDLIPLKEAGEFSTVKYFVEIYNEIWEIKGIDIPVELTKLIYYKEGTECFYKYSADEKNDKILGALYLKLKNTDRKLETIELS